MYRMFFVSLSVLALMLIPTVCAAQTQTGETAELEKEAALLDDAATKIGNDKTFEKLSTEFGVPVETLKTEQSNYNLGFGDLFIGNALAKASGKEFTVLADQYKAGQGWGEIAQANGLKLGSVVSQLKRSNKAVGHEHAAQSNREKQGSAEKTSKSHQSGQGRGNASGHGPK